MAKRPERNGSNHNGVLRLLKEYIHLNERRWKKFETWMGQNEIRWEESDARWEKNERRWEENQRLWQENGLRWNDADAKFDLVLQGIRDIKETLRRRGS